MAVALWRSPPAAACHSQDRTQSQDRRVLNRRDPHRPQPPAAAVHAYGDHHPTQYPVKPASFAGGRMAVDQASRRRSAIGSETPAAPPIRPVAPLRTGCSLRPNTPTPPRHPPRPRILTLEHLSARRLMPNSICRSITTPIGSGCARAMNPRSHRSLDEDDHFAACTCDCAAAVVARPEVHAIGP
jgi:hypothetical protein